MVFIITTQAIKMFHDIFDYNYWNSWQILIIFVPLETWMNAPPRSYKLSNQIQPIHVANLPDKKLKLKNKQKQPTSYCNAFCGTYCSTFSQTVVQCSFFFRCLLEIPSAVFWQKMFYILMGFYPKFILKLNVINFKKKKKKKVTCKVKFNCRDLWRIKVMTSSS